jgi:hypothetical protein
MYVAFPFSKASLPQPSWVMRHKLDYFNLCLISQGSHCNVYCYQSDQIGLKFDIWATLGYFLIDKFSKSQVNSTPGVCTIKQCTAVIVAVSL